MTRCVITLASLLVATPARAERTTSAIAMGHGPVMTAGLAVSLRQGSRPSFLAATRRYQQLAIGVRTRGGWAGGFAPTDLGSQYGFDYDLFVGYVGKESDPVDPETEAGFSFRGGVVLRVLTARTPVPLALLVHSSGELEAGFARWWSNTARLNIMGGLRLTAALPGGFSMELDYTAVPFTLTGSPHDIYVDRFAHRVRLSGGHGPFGLLLQVLVSHDRVRPGKRGPIEQTSDQALSIIAEWRLGI